MSVVFNRILGMGTIVFGVLSTVLFSISLWLSGVFEGSDSLLVFGISVVEICVVLVLGISFEVFGSLLKDSDVGNKLKRLFLWFISLAFVLGSSVSACILLVMYGFSGMFNISDWLVVFGVFVAYVLILFLYVSSARRVLLDRVVKETGGIVDRLDGLMRVLILVFMLLLLGLSVLGVVMENSFILTEYGSLYVVLAVLVYAVIRSWFNFIVSRGNSGER